MPFEIINKDLSARIGRLKTKSGIVETPLLFPVINPSIQVISPKTLEQKFNCNALITNAYIINKNFKEVAIDRGLHNFLDFNGSIMTDSGAYQLLIYNDIEITPTEIVQFQESIDTDIATILDIPTGWNVSKKYARYTVNETFKRAKALKKMKSRDDIAWVGPIQGGQYLDLVSKSAKIMGDLPFQIHALGSPTPVMEQYKFDVLVDMIIAAKMNLPHDRPFHLFGAGHPFMFSLAVALGCDLFDSAAYALFAREGRYLTESGTARLNELQYFPCCCPACNQTDPQTVRELPKEEREKLLAEHNLHISFSELKKVKQAITDGRLWEHMEMRAHGHPSLLQALKRVAKYSSYLEKNNPVTKKNGIFFFSHLGLARPEVLHYKQRLMDRYSPPPNSKILLLLPQVRKKPFHQSKEYGEVIRELQRTLNEKLSLIHICIYSAPFGVIPIELDDVYPLSQNLIAYPFDNETISYVAKQVKNYLTAINYEHVILLCNKSVWKGKILATTRQVCKKKNVQFSMLRKKDPWAQSSIEQLSTSIQEALSIL